MLIAIALGIVVVLLYALLLFGVFWGILGLVLFGINPLWVPVVAIPLIVLSVAGLLGLTGLIKEELM